LTQVKVAAGKASFSVRQEIRPRRERKARSIMTKLHLHLPHDAFVFVGDGRKALFLRNEGDEKFPNLKTERVFSDVNPATHEQGTDKPGRAFSSVGAARSSVGTTDWHDLEEHRFADDVAAALERVVRERKVKALVIVAPPRTLAELRRVLHADVKKCIIAEVDKDLTKQPVYEIERHLAA
jgi:protein required for attachment to host cells